MAAKMRKKRKKIKPRQAAPGRAHAEGLTPYERQRIDAKGASFREIIFNHGWTRTDTDTNCFME
jgi:hypothetical protein